MKIAVYTAIFRNYDSVKSYNLNFNNDADFWLFTDNKNIATSDIQFKFIKCVSVPQSQAIKESRKYKMLPHIYLPGYDYYIWLDGSIELLENPKKLIDKYMQSYNIATGKHPFRNCIYNEAIECLQVGLSDSVLINKQMEFLKSENYPEDNGLCELGVIIRKNNQSIRKFNEFWWNIFEYFPTRDQLSFCYCCWKLRIKYNLFDTKKRETEDYKPTEFKLYPHL